MGKAEFNDIGPSVLSPRGASDLPLRERGKGYTLIEVMIAVTLTLVLMYALAAIFGRVTSIMTQTQDILSMTNNLRAAKDRLREDLENLTVPHLKAPTSRYGFFSYSEGLGNAFSPLNYTDFPFESRTHTTYGNFDRNPSIEDNTVGDTDDILSFTVRAPAGKWFRGRCFKELNEYTSDYEASIDDNIEMIESEYAEVIWFLRGTTLYRRVLLIVPDDFLKKRLQSLNRYIRYWYTKNPSQNQKPNFPDLISAGLTPSRGYGFYRFFDVSVHFDENADSKWSDLDGNDWEWVGRIVANSLPDLANRKNRFGYWSSPVIGSWGSPVFEETGVVLQGRNVFDLGLHGDYGSWYWLRFPTLWESSLWTGYPGINPVNNSPLSVDNWYYEYFRAGFPFGSPIEFEYAQPSIDETTAEGGGVPQRWMGELLNLELGYIGQNRDNGHSPANLPPFNFIDQWQVPNPWRQQQVFSGQLDLSKIIFTNTNDQSSNNQPVDLKVLNNDVLLTNVLSFDVKVWNEAGSLSSFVDLGEQEQEYTSPSDFRSSGNYSLSRVEDVTKNAPLYDPATNGLLSVPYRPVMPAVFDTWTDEYQKDFLSQVWSREDGTIVKNLNASSRPGFVVGDIPLDGNVTVADLPDYPPPYEAEIKVIQVELRAFDPVSRTIKNATVEIKIP